MRDELEDIRVAGPLAEAADLPLVILEAQPEPELTQVLLARTLPHLTFYFDVVSPYAWLAFERLPEVLAGLSYSVSYQPVFLGAILKHWGQKGPAEIAPKRAWMIRQVHWLARQYELVGWQWPAVHPFNSLPLLRLAMACGPGPGGTPSRWVVEALFRHVWHGGHDPADPRRLTELQALLAPVDNPDPAHDPDMKAALTAATLRAIEQGVFGVPAIALDGQLYWGLESLPMLADRLRWSESLTGTD